MNSTHQLLHELTKTVAELGVEKTKGILSNSRSQNKAIEFTNFVIDMVCRKFDMQFSQIIDLRDQNNKRVQALKFISFYCLRDTKEKNGNQQSKVDISKKLKRGKTLLWSYTEEMRLRHADSKDGLQKYFKAFDSEIEDYIKKR